MLTPLPALTECPVWPEPALRVATPPADDVIDPLRYDIATPADEGADTAGNGQVSLEGAGGTGVER